MASTGPTRIDTMESKENMPDTLKTVKTLNSVSVADAKQASAYSSSYSKADVRELKEVIKEAEGQGNLISYIRMTAFDRAGSRKLVEILDDQVLLRS